MSTQVRIPRSKIAKFCKKWQIVEFSLFGSILRDDYGPDSDVDVLVRFHPEAHYTLFDLVHMQEELSHIFGRDVDLMEKPAIERSRNYLRRKAILGSAELVYAS